MRHAGEKLETVSVIGLVTRFEENRVIGLKHPTKGGHRHRWGRRGTGRDRRAGRLSRTVALRVRGGQAGQWADGHAVWRGRPGLCRNAGYTPHWGHLKPWELVPCPATAPPPQRPTYMTTLARAGPSTRSHLLCAEVRPRPPGTPARSARPRRPPLQPFCHPVPRARFLKHLAPSEIALFIWDWSHITHAPWRQRVPTGSLFHSGTGTPRGNDTSSLTADVRPGGRRPRLGLGRRERSEVRHTQIKLHSHGEAAGGGQRARREPGGDRTRGVC